MKQAIHELTRTQLIAKVEAEVDRFRFRSGEAPEPGVKEPSHDKRMDVDFSKKPGYTTEANGQFQRICAAVLDRVAPRFERASWAPEALSSTATGKRTSRTR